MKYVSIRDAESSFSPLIAAVERGEEVVLLRRQKPVARLVPWEPPTVVRTPGALRGAISLAPNFDEMPRGFDRYMP